MIGREKIEEIIFNTKRYNSRSFWDKKVYTCESDGKLYTIEYDYRDKSFRIKEPETNRYTYFEW